MTGAIREMWYLKVWAAVPFWCHLSAFLPTSFPFWNSNSTLWQDGAGQRRENTKIASSDLSFINVSTPAATHRDRLWQRKKRKNIKQSAEVFSHSPGPLSSSVKHGLHQKGSDIKKKTPHPTSLVSSSSISYQHCIMSGITHSHYYCQHYKYTPWMHNYIIQFGNSLASAMWLAAIFSFQGLCGLQQNHRLFRRKNAFLTTLLLTSNETQRLRGVTTKNTSSPHQTFNVIVTENTGS